MTIIRLIVVDDHALMREGLVGLLDEETNLSVIAQAGSAGDAIAAIASSRPDIAIIDLGLPDRDGISLTEEITRQFPEVKVLIVTMYERDDYLFRALRAGALGYVLKGSDTRSLLEAVRAVHAGKVHIYKPLTPELVRDYLHGAPTGPGAGPDPLTERETEVLRLVAAGMTTPDISRELDISPHTVRSHRDHLMTKLDLHSKVQLTRYAIRAGIADFET